MRGNRPGRWRHLDRGLQPVARPDRDPEPECERRAAGAQRGSACHWPGAGGPGGRLPGRGGRVRLVAAVAVDRAGRGLVIGLIVWIARASGRRSAAAAGWHSRVINTYAKGQALADALGMAEARGAPAAGEAAAGWAGLQARADDLTQELYSLRESAPREEDRELVADVLASLQALRSAMAEKQAAGGAGGARSPDAAQVHSRLMSFEASLRGLRAPEEQLPRI